ncbi:hypothetical protein QLS71_003100 [Mariniflexile litorale]|uniref:Secreted protein n=1 Tax=Mariniflexile litorale TaxID=3045158 RepID=A0AAU7EFQ8_9FLAO|nr:hypothetical protein [Mariniflexile sp. KMM 9835]MDQ8210007.1 hypothetical protein [Mariniflexile sp. KMM 9835]
MKKTLNALGLLIMVFIIGLNIDMLKDKSNTEGANDLLSINLISTANAESNGNFAEKKVTTIVTQSEEENIGDCKKRTRTRAAAEVSCPGTGNTLCTPGTSGTGAWGSWVTSSIPGCQST